MFGYPIFQVIAYSGLHFFLSGWVAFSVYWWMWTTLSPTLPVGHRVGSYMRRGLLLLSVSFALVAHIAEDYLIGWF